MRLRFCALFLSIFVSPIAASAQTIYQAHTQVDLISDSTSIQLGQTFWVGLRMKMDPDWHVYWKNPGDSGLKPSIEWRLPQGFKAGGIQWPYPSRISVGPLTSFGYENEVILWSHITAPDKIADPQISIAGNIKWLTCKVDCIPGQAEVSLNVSVDRTAVLDPLGFQELEKSKVLWPIDKAPWDIRALEQGEDFVIVLRSLSPEQSLNDLMFFPDSDQLIEHAFIQKLTKAGDGYQLNLRKSNLIKDAVENIEGVLVSSSGWDDPGKSKALVISLPLEKEKQVLPAAPPSRSFWVICGFAFLGGIILNFMPCVLPVLTLKILGLIRSGISHRKILISGALFAAGVLVSFWILAAILILLKSAGHQLGWGFQFQSPVFVGGMAVLLFVLALNLLGVFEITIALAGTKDISSKDHWGSFLSGVLATVIATPCTAPFMGTAVGFALSQTSLTALFIFTFLGLGMASPYLAVCIFPSLLSFLPKPGKWMVFLKIIFGFVLLACVIWLLWVLGLQKGVDAVLIVLFGLWLIALGLWIWGVLQHSKGNMWISLLAVIMCISGITISLGGIKTLPKASSLSTGPVGEHEIAWEEFSPEFLKQLISEQKAVLVDFTAAWCLTCQVNDRVVFKNQKVVDIFKQFGIIGLKADWTNYNKDITEALEGYGKRSIPLYVLYVPGRPKPVILPELITVEYFINVVLENFKIN